MNRFLSQFLQWLVNQLLHWLLNLRCGEAMDPAVDRKRARSRLS